MYGSPSHVDTFDYKPALASLEGQPVPESLRQNPNVASVVNLGRTIMPSPWSWKQRGESGLWVSDLLPHLAERGDDLCVVRSMYSESNNHAPAGLLVNTGVIIEGKPSIGSWLTYGLGSDNQNLPGFVVLYEVGGYGGPANWGSAFLPASFQGTRFREEGAPLFDLEAPPQFVGSQQATIDLVQAMNHEHRAVRPGQSELDARIASYELAYRMQSEASDASELEQETEATRRLYGLDEKHTAKFGRMCLLARRMVERGVRVVQIYNGLQEPKDGWDAHSDLKRNHEFNAAQTDKPAAALLTDLKQRGLLDRTLVVWCGEFGRTPMSDENRGRNHNRMAFSIWLAGGGVRGGQAIGATDEIGLHAEVDPYSVHDLHATILQAFGIPADDLFFLHNGRPERLTGVAGSSSPIPAF